MADDPYTADAAPLTISIRSTFSNSKVARLVTPEGRPSRRSSDRLLIPENCGLNPRMPIPESAPLYWTTSTPAFFLSRSVRSAATDRLISYAVFCLKKKTLAQRLDGGHEERIGGLQDLVK